MNSPSSSLFRGFLNQSNSTFTVVSKTQNLINSSLNSLSIWSKLLLVQNSILLSSRIFRINSQKLKNNSNNLFKKDYLNGKNLLLGYHQIFNRKKMSATINNDNLIGENHSLKHSNVTSKWRAESLIKSNNLNNTIEIDHLSISNLSLNQIKTICIFVKSEQIQNENELSKLLKFNNLDESLIKLNSSQLNDFNAELKSTLILYPSNS